MKFISLRSKKGEALPSLGECAGTGNGLQTHLRKRKRATKFRNSLGLYALLLPSLVLMILFSYVPMYGIIIAFKDYNSVQGIFGSPWASQFGFKHFIRFVTAYNFWTLIKNTLVISIYSLVVGAICPVILALFVNEIRNKAFKRTVSTVSYSPYFISCVVIVGMIFGFFNADRGFINKIVQLFNGGKPVFFMSDPKYFVHLYVWSGVWQTVGWASIIYLGALSSVDPALHEAACIEGAGRLRRIWHINLPAIIPLFTVQLILSVGNIMGVGFEKAFLMQTDANLETSEIIATYVYKISLQRKQYSFGTAVGLFNAVVNIILLVSVNGISKKIGQESLW